MLPRLLDLASCLTMLHLVAAVGAGWEKSNTSVLPLGGQVGSGEVCWASGVLAGVPVSWGIVYACAVLGFSVRDILRCVIGVS